MPKSTTTKPIKGGREHKAAAPKAPVPVEQRLTKLYRTLHDQIQGEFLSNALKTCDKILRLASTDTLATQTKVQLLIAVDRYPAALTVLDSSSNNKDQPTLERIYCLYKTGRVAEAAEGLESLDEQVADERAVRLLEAQVDSPELADLQANLAAATLHLDFLSSVPTTLSHSSVPSLDSLESTPIGPLIHSNPSYKSTPLVASTIASTSKSSLPKKVKLSATGKTYKKSPQELDPDRWIPKRERPAFAEEIVRKREQDRGRKKQKMAAAAGLTQGAAEPMTVQPKVALSGGGGGAKKKKGGKK
ncbi:hypothetical protein P7C70_g251, partial [Phenoliferia sp. Uapishka_3]